MKIVDAISQIFIWGIGITRPKPGQEHRAGVYITSLFIGSLIFVAIAFAFLVLRHSK